MWILLKTLTNEGLETSAKFSFSLAEQSPQKYPQLLEKSKISEFARPCEHVQQNVRTEISPSKMLILTSHLYN